MNPANIRYCRASSDWEFQQILDIQRRNTRSGLSPEEIKSEGFITVVHDLQLLRKMNKDCPHILALEHHRVAGYALTMLPSFCAEVPVLAPLFEITEELFRNRNYLVMGQICIDRPFRGHGVFRGLYEYYQQQLSRQFDCLVTEVALDNPRSLCAHKRVGFETAYTRVKDGVSWELLVWEWRF